MQQTINIAGKSITVNVSKDAALQLATLKEPLVMEMELYFSCLIRKAVHFGVEANSALSQAVGENLLLSFRPVMTNSCKVDGERAPELTDFPISNMAPYVPRWVSIDYRHGDWQGDFGYA